MKAGDRSGKARVRRGRSYAIGAEVQLLYPDMGISEPLGAVAERYDLDLEALHAAAQSALAAPDRVVVLEVEARAPA